MKRINGATLKWIAVLCMLIDHIGAVLVEPICLGRVPATILTLRQWVILYYILRGIGRIAFPIFCFLLIEGFTKTRSRKHYLRNLVIFSFISEVPFNCAIANKPFTLQYQNVFFTLVLGFLAIWSIEYIEAKCMERNLLPIWGFLISLLPAAVIAFVAESAHTDYGAIGVATICIFYIFRKKATVGALIAWAVLSLFNGLEVFCLPCVWAINLYNGEHGKQNKYFFYVFYPLHLMILYGISKLLF